MCVRSHLKEAMCVLGMDSECSKKRRPEQVTLKIELWRLKEVQLKADWRDCV